MTDPHTRLTRHNGKWHIMARMGVTVAAEGSWVSLGGCTCQLTIIRVWLASLAQDKR